MEDGSRSLITSLGVGVLSNTEYESKCSREVRKAQADLDEIRRRSVVQISKCWAEYGMMYQDMRHRQEKEIVSTMVERELNMFRQEMQEKETQEDNRIRHLYSSLLGDTVQCGAKQKNVAIPCDVQKNVAIPCNVQKNVAIPCDVQKLHEGDTFIEVAGHPPIIHSSARFPSSPSVHGSQHSPIIHSSVRFPSSPSVQENQHPPIIQSFARFPSSPSVQENQHPPIIQSFSRFPSSPSIHEVRLKNGRFRYEEKTPFNVMWEDSNRRISPRTVSSLSEKPFDTKTMRHEGSSIDPDEEFVEVERMLQRNQERLEKLTALHF